MVYPNNQNKPPLAPSQPPRRQPSPNRPTTHHRHSGVHQLLQRPPQRPDLHAALRRPVGRRDRRQPAVLHQHHGVKPNGTVQQAGAHEDDVAREPEAPAQVVCEVGDRPAVGAGAGDAHRYVVLQQLGLLPGGGPAEGGLGGGAISWRCGLRQLSGMGTAVMLAPAAAADAIATASAAANGGEFEAMAS
jgi:hypothetical protein